jgi:glycosyltransferase involved in cell wall biosynthesis
LVAIALGAISFGVICVISGSQSKLEIRDQLSRLAGGQSSMENRQLNRGALVGDSELTPNSQPLTPTSEPPPHPQPLTPCLSVCHLISGDLWAGAEAQVAALLKALSHDHGFQLSAILLNEGRLRDELSRCGIELTVIPENRYGFAGILKCATDALRGRGIKVLHSHRYKENLLAVLLARRCDIPVVVRTQHGAPEPFGGLKRIKQAMLGKIDRLVARFATDCVISVSRELQHQLARHVNKEKIAWIPNGLDTTAVSSKLEPGEAKKRLGIPAASPVLGYAGRLAAIKRLDLFIAAAKEVNSRIPEATFVVAGQGSERQALQQAASGIGLERQFLFLGHRDDIYDVLRAFDVFVLPSDHEGLPMVLLEALYLGIPVVSRRVGGIPEAIENRKSGLLLDSPNPQSIANACIELLQNPALRASLAAAGKRGVSEHFSAARTAGLTADVYRKAVASK